MRRVGRTRGQIAGHHRKREEFDKYGSGGRRQTGVDSLYRATTKTGAVGRRYTGTMETVAVGGDATEMKVNEGR